MPTKVIVFVPGGMGTTLSLNGMRVWNFDPPKHFEGTRMISDPALLVPWLPLVPGHLLSHYDGFVKLLLSYGYVEGQDLFLWGFDWRRGMEANALELADFVDNTVKGKLGTKKILFIAHSSGCMILRWALLFGAAVTPTVPLIDNALVDQVVAAGPPMLGMARPFKDLVQMPRIDDTFDSLFTLLRWTNPSFADQVSVPINKILMSVTAQLEGLTPDDIPILSGGSGPPGPPFGVFQWKGWPAELQALRNSVQATQAKLKGTPWGAIKCSLIVSQSHDTETGYALNNKDEYQSDWLPAPGDDSVLLASATAYCPSAPQVLVGEHHRTLLDDAAAQAHLATII